MGELFKVFLLTLLLTNFCFISTKIIEEDISFKNFVEEKVKKYLSLLELSEGTKSKFLATDQYLNISDFSINAILSIGHRAYGNMLDMKVKNDSHNTLPIPIDTLNLAAIIDELNQFDNTPMSLRIYENTAKHKKPTFETIRYGSLLSLAFGMEFGIFFDKDKEATIVLSIDLDLTVKIQLSSKDNILSVGITKIFIDGVKYNIDTLKVDKEKLENSLASFFKIAAGGMAEDLSKIDVLAILNQQTRAGFTEFSVFLSEGSINIKLK